MDAACLRLQGDDIVIAFLSSSLLLSDDENGIRLLECSNFMIFVIR
jgi:hypothetical protein